MSAASLNKLGLRGKLNSLLRLNHYKWFHKVERGIYGISDENAKKIETEHHDLWNYHLTNLKGIIEK